LLKRRAALGKWEAARAKYPGNVRRLTPADVRVSETGAR